MVAGDPINTFVVNVEEPPGRTPDMPLSVDDLDTILSALATAASRRESQARAVKHGKHHDDAAAKMRALRRRLLTHRRRR